MATCRDTCSQDAPVEASTIDGGYRTRDEAAQIRFEIAHVVGGK